MSLNKQVADLGKKTEISLVVCILKLTNLIVCKH